MDRWDRADAIIDQVEHVLIVILLSLMILIAFVQIVLRNLFATGLSWGDPLIRNLVLWVGFIGAAIATREGKHITIDLIGRRTSSREKILIDTIIQFFSFFICVLLTYAAGKFINNEAHIGTTTFLGIPAWLPQTILPVTFGVMAFRFGLQCVKSFLLSIRADAIPGGTGDK